MALSSSDSELPISESPTQDLQSAPVPDRSEPNELFSGDASDGEQRDSESIKDVPERIGDYQIKGLIGSGGMGDVFLAEHVRMERVVAIKMLPMERMRNQDSVDRFYAEVRAASRLLHPNIVTAFDAGEVDDEEFGGVHYLAMEYVDGITLTQVIAQGGPMTVGQAAAAIRQAALGLLHAHRAGIVHRDVKPGNLMRATDGTVKVLDLGLARMGLTDEALATSGPDNGSQPATGKEKGRVVGTLPFMSPEQLEDPKSADPRSDIYGLGATLHFLLTARPPYPGEYLDQVYGHRHGEIPDLMQLRDDVDLNFANIFRRMLAKSPDERYASLDEVVDDLAPYASDADTPTWLIEFSQRSGPDSTVQSVSSTMGGQARVFGIDLGMHYSAAAAAAPTGESVQLVAGQADQRLFRMAIAYDDGLVFDQQAIRLRNAGTRSIAHCLQLYIGQSAVARNIGGQYCPPEVLLALTMREIYSQSWDGDSPPHATAITVPASYDQLHRRAIRQAAELAGFSSVRLLDRSIAAVHSLWDHDQTDPSVPADSFDAPSVGNDFSGNDSPGAELSNGDLPGTDLPRTGEHSIESVEEQHLLFVGLTGGASEVAVLRRVSSRLEQLATTGHWHGGTLPWLHRLVDMAADEFLRLHSLDPKASTATAAKLQVACEQAMNSMLLVSEVNVLIDVAGQPLAVPIERQEWLERCDDLIQATMRLVMECCDDASVKIKEIDRVVLMGPVLRIPAVRCRVLPDSIDPESIVSVDRSDVAQGAAASLASELPGRGDVAMPPRNVTSQTIGIVVEDAKHRRRILPLIRKGTSLPARTNRRLTVGSDQQTMKVSLVESSGVDGNEWHALGSYQIEGVEGVQGRQSRTISFEIDVNGLLSVRAPLPITAKGSSSAGLHGSTKLPPLPAPNLTEEEVIAWSKWIDETEKASS